MIAALVIIWLSAVAATIAAWHYHITNPDNNSDP